jgi:hypothetical protein
MSVGLVRSLARAMRRSGRLTVGLADRLVVGDRRR